MPGRRPPTRRLAHLVLQQARGARNLLVAACGTSLLGAALMVVSLLVVLRG